MGLYSIRDILSKRLLKMKTAFTHLVTLQPTNDQIDKLNSYRSLFEHTIDILQNQVIELHETDPSLNFTYTFLKPLLERLPAGIPFGLREFALKFVLDKWQYEGSRRIPMRPLYRGFRIKDGLSLIEKTVSIKIFDDEVIDVSLNSKLPFNEEIASCIISIDVDGKWTANFETVDYQIENKEVPYDLKEWIEEKEQSNTEHIPLLFNPERTKAYSKILKLDPGICVEDKLEEMIEIYNKVFNIVVKQLEKTTDLSKTYFIPEMTISKIYTKLKRAGHIYLFGYSDDLGRSVRKEIVQFIINVARKEKKFKYRDLSKANHFVLTSDRIFIDTDRKVIELMKGITVRYEGGEDFKWFKDVNNTFIIWREEVDEFKSNWFIRFTQPTKESRIANRLNKEKWKERFRAGLISNFEKKNP